MQFCVIQSFLYFIVNGFAKLSTVHCVYKKWFSDSTRTAMLLQDRPWNTMLRVLVICLFVWSTRHILWETISHSNNYTFPATVCIAASLCWTSKRVTCTLSCSHFSVASHTTIADRASLQTLQRFSATVETLFVSLYSLSQNDSWNFAYALAASNVIGIKPLLSAQVARKLSIHRGSPNQCFRSMLLGRQYHDPRWSQHTESLALSPCRGRRERT